MLRLIPRTQAMVNKLKSPEFLEKTIVPSLRCFEVFCPNSLSLTGKNFGSF